MEGGGGKVFRYLVMSGLCECVGGQCCSVGGVWSVESVDITNNNTTDWRLHNYRLLAGQCPPGRPLCSCSCLAGRAVAWDTEHYGRLLEDRGQLGW